MIRDFAPGKPRHGYVLAQGSSSTVNLVKTLARLDEAGINVKVISAVSEDLFDHQPEAYRNSVLPPEAYYDLMVVSTGTRRVWPVRGLGPLTDEYSLTSDWDNQWLTGGLEARSDRGSPSRSRSRFSPGFSASRMIGRNELRPSATNWPWCDSFRTATNYSGRNRCNSN